MHLRNTILAGLLGLASSVESKIVQTNTGTFQGGKCSLTDVNYFFSIPYAKPPVGERRFAPPEPLSNSSSKVVNATAPAPSCLQFSGGLFDETNTQSEDCLFLNVYVPATPSPKLPVKVWLYGGSNAAGGISDAIYNGCFSAQDSIIVTVNYRVGPLGFLALEDLGLTGNYGIQDQLLALRWVNENIAEFGGDPQKVLLFGESAGAIDTFVLSTLPEVSQLVRAVAMESGAGRDLATLADSKVWYTEFLNAMNCTTPDLSCLRTASPSAIKAAAKAMPTPKVTVVNTALANNGTRSAWTPILDGTVIKAQPSTIGVRIPAIIGSNAAEGALFVLTTYGAATLHNALTQAQYDAFLTYNFGPLATRVNETYSATRAFNGSVLAAMTEITTDVSYRCPSYRALVQAEKNSVPVWSYRFSHVPSCSWYTGLQAAWIPYLGATHTTEIPFVFNFTANMPPPDGNCTFTPAEQTLAHDMSRAWTNMAELGRPGEQTVWPEWRSNGSVGVVMDGAMVPGVVDYSTCGFWDTVNSELNEYWNTRG
ncbi:alpha/beta-hydrolase [Annulohypoxylon maeteangense]|uniref:alpha/beta-hydrolase n=1 Tax=Annulohypoxylon maeteangense TaxID=1927788 RepID=UPI0020087280|nr:alpha/beta-hydrolase [Annulohypoxylon maeteangense]KAI0881991.1 alpha/beta-hydrolase [Annulohypoxylon maeteangense]